MKHLSEGVEHPIWDAIQTKNITLVCQAVFKGIDLDMKNRWGDTLKDVLAGSKIWHGRLLSDEASSRGSGNQKIPCLFYKQLAASGMSGDDLLCEALLRRGFLVFQDSDGVGLGSGSHADDLIVLEMVAGINVTRVSGHSERLALIAFAAPEVDQLRVVEGKRIASHVRSYARARHSTTLEHLPPQHQQYLGWSPERLTRWAERIGPNVKLVVECLLSSRQHPLQAYRTCLGVIRLGKTYGDGRLDAACYRALHVNAVTYRSIESMLKTGMDKKPLILDSAQTTLPLHENVRGPTYFH